MRRTWIIVPFLLLASCDLAEEDFQPQLVVEAMLFAGEPFPDIRLTQTTRLGAPFDPRGGGVAAVDVRVVRLGEGGEPDITIPYVLVGSEAGVYAADVPPSAVVQPLRRYRLRVTLPDESPLVPAGAVVSGETLVPDTFRVVVPPPDSVAYAPLQTPPEFRITRSNYPGRQSIYQFSIISLEPETYGLTPTYAAIIDAENADQLVENSSPLLNESSYDTNPDGTITLSIPWLGIAYYGANRLIVHALDDAIFDFLRSRDAQFGSTTLSPGEIPEVLTNLDHAVGVFGSASRVSVEVFFAP